MIDTDVDIPIEYQIKNKKQNSINSPNKISIDKNKELSNKDNDIVRKFNKKDYINTILDK